jgi:O-antigen ligase
MSFSFALLSVYVGLLFFEPQQFFPALKQIRITYTFGILFLGWALVASPRTVKSNLFRSSIFKLIIIFFGLCSISLLETEFPVSENREYLTLLKTTALFLMVALNIRTESDFIRLCWLLLIFSTISAAVTIYYYHLDVLPTRMLSYFGTPGQSGSNEFAALMVEMSPFPIMLLLGRRPLAERTFLSISLFMCLYCLTRTRSRAGLVAFVIILLAVAVYRYISTRHLAVILTVLALLFIKSPGSYFDRMSTIVSEETYKEDRDVVTRIENYKRALSTIRDNPILGIGISNTANYFRPMMRPNERIFVIHNAYLEAGVETGLPGMLVFCLLVFHTFRGFKRYASHLSNTGSLSMKMQSFMNAATIAVLGYASMAMTLSIRFDRIFFILMALAASIPHILAQQNHSSQK